MPFHGSPTGPPAGSGGVYTLAGRVRQCHGSGRVGSGRVGSGRVGSGRVGSGRVGSGRVGSVRVGSGRVRRLSNLTGRLRWRRVTLVGLDPRQVTRPCETACYAWVPKKGVEFDPFEAPKPFFILIPSNLSPHKGYQLQKALNPSPYTKFQVN